MVERRIEWLHQISFNNKFMLFNCIHVCLKFRLSGFQLPSSIVSSGSILTLWFTTDFAVSAQGFKALYEGKMLAMHHPHPLCRQLHTGQEGCSHKPKLLLQRWFEWFKCLTSVFWCWENAIYCDGSNFWHNTCVDNFPLLRELFHWKNGFLLTCGIEISSI